MFTAAHHEGHCAQIDSTQSQKCNLVNTITLSNTQSALILEHLRLELFVTQVYDIKTVPTREEYLEALHSAARINKKVSSVINGIDTHLSLF